jgi:uncharacterized cupin superfamily protein
VGLEQWPEIPAETLTAAKPAQRGHMYFEDPSVGLSAGVWDGTAVMGKLEPYPVNKFMFVLEGGVMIVPEHHRAVAVEAGEGFLIPKRNLGDLTDQWRVSH